MTDDDESGSELSLRRVLGLVGQLPAIRPGHLLDASQRGVWAVLEVVRLALEADEEATVEVLREHEDALDTLYALAKIIRDGGD